MYACSTETRSVLRCIKSIMGSRLGEGILPLCCALVRTARELYLALEPLTGGHKTVRANTEEATQVIRGLEHLCY